MERKADTILDEWGRYTALADAAILQATLLFDYAVSTEKMMSFACVGEDNSAWKEGPYVSSGAGQEQIDRSTPFCLRVSKETSVAAGIVLGPNPELGQNGGYRLPLLQENAQEWQSEKVIAKLSMIEQFELYRDFARVVSGPYNAKTSERCASFLPPEVLDSLKVATDRRNELTHDSEICPATIREAVEYFCEMKWIAASVVESNAGITGLADREPWKHLVRSMGEDGRTHSVPKT